jgi:hypothetical protein
LSWAKDLTVSSEPPVALGEADQQDVEIVPEGRQETRGNQVKPCRASPVEMLGTF